MIGMNEPVMEALSAPDQVAYIRVTSAYHNFREAKDGRGSRADRPDDNRARLWVEQPPMVDLHSS